MREAATIRRAAAPLSVGFARLRARPGRSLLLAAGVAGATTMLIAVLGGGIVAKDRSVRAALAALPASDRSFRVDSFGLPPGESYRSADRKARGVLASLSPVTPIAGTFFRQLEIGNGLVELVSLGQLAARVRLRAGRLPRECVPARCEVLQVGSGGRSEWRQDGIDLVRVGIAEVPDAALYGPWLAAGSQATRLLAAGPDAFARIPALDGFYRVHSWIAPVAPAQIHVWQIGTILARESRAQTALAQAGAEYELSGPDSALTDARTTAAVAGQRLDLIGGEISVLLLGFALVAAVGLRRGLAAERRRLVQRGATRAQVLVSVVTEVGLTTVAGTIGGAVAGVAAVAVIARRAGLPWQAVLRHGPGSPTNIALVVGLWLAATVALMAVAVRRPDGRGTRVLDALALAAAAGAAIGFARGGLDASTLAAGGDATFLLLLPGLVCFAAAIAAARLLGPLMRAAERVTRRSKPAVRLAMLGLARAPARTAATAAFLVVALGLAVFATAYRSTLQRGAADEAAFAVPLDFTLTEGPRLVLPLEAAPPAGYDALAPGVHAYPVIRQTADVPGPGTTALNPTVLGLPAGALARLHWRADFASRPLSTLAARIEADPPVTLRTLPLPPGATLSLPARERGTAVQLDLAAENAAGDPVLLQLNEQGGNRFVTHTPPGAPLRLVGLEISVIAGEANALAHRAAEGSQATIPSGSVVLGPLAAAGRTLTSWRGWVARGGSINTSGPARVSYAFTTGQTVLVRRRQATDGRPLLVIASSAVAGAAGPGRAIVLDFGTGRIPARIVGVATAFPDSQQQGGGFVIAEESRLRVALDGTLPGTGRPIELWLSVPPAQVGRVGRALARPPFSSLVTASRARLERSLSADPLARGVTLTLAAAGLVAVALAVLALWLALVAELGDERGELFDLEAQGVSPETLRRQFRVRAAVLTLTAVAGGMVLGLVLSRLVVVLVRLSAGGTTPEPPLLFVPAWRLDAAGLATLALAVAIAVELATHRAFRGEEPGRASWSLE